MVKGIPSSPGEGVGPAVILSERSIPPDMRVSSTDRETELSRFQTGLRVTSEYYRKTYELVKQRIGQDEADIFDGYLEILTGGDIEEGVQDALEGKPCISAVEAVLTFCGETADEFAEMDSEYFQQRAADIRDIGNRLAEAICFGDILDVASLSEPSVIIARELSPAYTVTLDLEHVAGIVTETGGPTSHAAILARSLTIPCVTGAEGALVAVSPGELCLVDGGRGVLERNISDERAKRVRENNRALKRDSELKREWSRNTEARLNSGEALIMKANISSAKDARLAVEAGAQGSGLVRTEFIFMSFNTYPTVDEQYEKYREICAILQPYTVTIRLLDCGADKPLPYSDQRPEENPFLGERGIRFLLSHREILADQLKAVGRLHSEGFKVQAMIPMVVTVAEIRAVRAILQDIYPELPLGIMVETPASVLRIGELARESDFLSIGTNDLVQYLLAIDRGNPRVVNLYQELHPAVITALDRIVTAARDADIPLGVCGDMASRPETILALLALGVRELSSSSADIPRLKELVTTLDIDFLADIRDELLISDFHDQNLRLLTQRIDDLTGENGT
ncbi:MAG: phosphoenolpyruvate--protein phosphotransferase [Spirochaeta sp. LUC14_002_19_P3]|nr:MAG: phosphoenolpyruvate--protein phosphotransferase [Spirochaeta sp. LUC14_002_19_P3]